MWVMNQIGIYKFKDLPPPETPKKRPAGKPPKTQQGKFAKVEEEKKQCYQVHEKAPVMKKPASASKADGMVKEPTQCRPIVIQCYY